MNRKIANGFAIYSRIDCTFRLDEDIVLPDILETSLDQVLNEIFSVDERTGLPKGDIAFYLSPDGNPTIKAWLENNLLKPRAVSSGTSIEGVTDDLLHEMQRGDNESFEDYLSRLVSIRNEAIENSNGK